jgi:hypothetical protein
MLLTNTAALPDGPETTDRVVSASMPVVCSRPTRTVGTSAGGRSERRSTTIVANSVTAPSSARAAENVKAGMSATPIFRTTQL